MVGTAIFRKKVYFDVIIEVFLLFLQIQVAKMFRIQWIWNLRTVYIKLGLSLFSQVIEDVFLIDDNILT